MKETKYNLHIAQLFNKLLKGEISPKEKKELQDWRDENSQNLLLYNKLTDAAYLHSQQIGLDAIDITQSWDVVLKRTKKSKKTSLGFLKYAAAISAIVFSLYLFYSRKNLNHNLSNHSENVINQRIAPGGKNAVLILSNGDQIDLRTNSGTILDKGSGIRLNNKSNILIYANKSTSNVDEKILYNTIVIPQGGEYQLRLADGTLIWMNSLSQLRYPTRFSKNHREVYLSGEAYFEVAKDASKPFIVSTKKTRVVVLGTRFNVSAYDDNPVNTTTLLEGSVKLQGRTSSSVLSPNQQALVDANGTIDLIRKVDANKSIDWKNGFFELENSDIRQIMTKAARWYDIKVQFENTIPETKLYGRISRNVDFDELLEILRFEGVNISVEGKNVFIKDGYNRQKK